MKKISIFLIGLVVTLSSHAGTPVSGSIVTVTVNSNKNLQLTIDGRSYTLENTQAVGDMKTISLANLETGQHAFQLTRTGLNTNRSDKISTTFNLRYDFDMLITINSNGSIELIETKKMGISNNQSPMNSANYNNLLRSVRSQRSPMGRRSQVAGAFDNTNNYFTTSQVIQLLQLINAEEYRLQLAKSSYRSITDRNNFDQVYGVLNSQASDDELEAYVSNYDEDDNNAAIAMTDAKFTALQMSIQQQWPANAQVNSISNAFNNTSNYFTAYQARQLIQIVTGENNRLQLAKSSYRGITDPNNFNQVYELLNSQASKDELTHFIGNTTGNNPNTAMADANFNNLYTTIKQQWPVDVQMNSLTTAFNNNNNNNYFSAYQIRQLIQLVSAENNRLQLAKLSFHTITDRNNFSDIYELLSSQASKNELTAYINNYGNNNSNTQMTDAGFTALYQTIQGQFIPNEKMNSITNAFNNTSNYFSTAQARQLIQLISFENNRLQLAKLSYRTITDRYNFSQLYDLLNSQASRDELDAYVKAF